MTSTQRMTAAALAVAILVPVASATWMASGTFEPSTKYDQPDAGRFMWTDAAPPGARQVYFNVVTTQGLPIVLAALQFSPNVGLLQTQNEVASHEIHTAYLGVWIDCNGDDYIGMLETAVREYASAALLAPIDDCAPQTGDDDEWSGQPNYNGWVTEFIPISRYYVGQLNPVYQDFPDHRVYVDRDAKVWGDYGAPDKTYTELTCPLVPFSRGMLHSTGGLLNYLDCRGETQGVDLLGSYNTLVDLAGDPLQLRWSDDDDAQDHGPGGSHPLDVSTFGDDDGANSAAPLFDCSQPRVLDGRQAIVDVVGEETVVLVEQNFLGAPIVLNVYPVDPQPNPDALSDPVGDRGFVPGTFNTTYEPVFQDCDYTNDRGDEFYMGTLLVTGPGTAGVGEDDFNGIDPQNKTEADWNFDYQPTQRGVATFFLGQTTEQEIESEFGELPVPFNGGSGIDMFDFGVGFSEPSCTTGPCWGWRADSQRASKLPHLVKADLSTPNVGPADAYYLSFYAYVNEQTRVDLGLTLPGGDGVYLSDFCPHDVRNPDGTWPHGFNCERGEWYRNPDGSTIVEPGSGTFDDPSIQGDEFNAHDHWSLARPLDPYNLRDVDCYDGSNTVGVPTGTAALGTNVCE